MSLIMKSGKPVDLELKVNHSRVNVSAANRKYVIVIKRRNLVVVLQGESECEEKRERGSQEPISSPLPIYLRSRPAFTA